ncbi:MAG TPA: hypothetical protein DCQ31_15875, partial [Bacteroidales bacterium]|nr:hypothetical protein [Bacteroidales bacterium]
MQKRLSRYQMKKNEAIKVLYIDDEEVNLFNFKLLFQDEFDIYTAISVAEGTKILDQHSIQIVVSDQRMPDKTGIEFFAEIADIYPDTVRILLTAYAEAGDIINAINIGQVYQYITKPFQAGNVLNILNKAAEQWLLKKENEALIIQLKEKNEEYESINEELRQNNEELYQTKAIAEESELRFRKLFEAANDAIFIADSLTGTIVDVNVRGEK